MPLVVAIEPEVSFFLICVFRNFKGDLLGITSLLAVAIFTVTNRTEDCIEIKGPDNFHISVVTSDMPANFSNFTLNRVIILSFSFNSVRFGIYWNYSFGDGAIGGLTERFSDNWMIFF